MTEKNEIEAIKTLRWGLLCMRTVLKDFRYGLVKPEERMIKFDALLALADQALADTNNWEYE